MYIYIYIHIYIYGVYTLYMYAYVYIYTYLGVFMYTHARSHTNTCTHVILFSTALGKNIARYGVATQSSTHGEGFAKRGIDGNVDGEYSQHSCSQTHTADDNPWWKVTFKHDILVTEVVLSNRADCCGKSLNGVIVDNNPNVVIETMFWQIGTESLKMLTIIFTFWKTRILSDAT